MQSFNEYNEFVKTMKVYPDENTIVYPTLGLSGEAGEVSEKVKKWLRGDGPLDRFGVVRELGDVLFYVTSLAGDLGYSLQDVVDANQAKLESRKERGVIKGSGDAR